MKNSKSALDGALGHFLKRLAFVLLVASALMVLVIVIALLFKKGTISLPDFSGAWSVLGMFGQGLAVVIGALILFGIRPMPTNYVGVTTLFGEIQTKVLHEGLNWVWFWYGYQKASKAPRSIKLEATEFEFRDAPSKVSGVHIQVQVNPTCPQNYFRLTEKTRESEVDGAVRSIVQKVLQGLIDNAGCRMSVDEFKTSAGDVTKELSRVLNGEMSRFGITGRVISLGDITLPDRVKNSLETEKMRERMAKTLEKQEGQIRKLVQEGLKARNIQPPVEESADVLQRRLIPLVVESLEAVGIVKPVVEDFAKREARLAASVRSSLGISSAEPVPAPLAKIFSNDMQTLRQLEEQKFADYAAVFTKALQELKAEERRRYDDAKRTYDQQVERLEASFQHEQEEATKQELFSKNPNFLLGLDPTGKQKKGK